MARLLPPVPLNPHLHGTELVHTRTRPTSATRRHTRPGRELKLGNIYLRGGSRTSSPPPPTRAGLWPASPPTPRSQSAHVLWRSPHFQEAQTATVNTSCPSELALCPKRVGREDLEAQESPGGRTWTQLWGWVGGTRRSLGTTGRHQLNPNL